MKNILLFSIVLMLFSCRNSDKVEGYTVEGKIENFTGENVFLDKINMNNVEIVDTSSLNGKGYFEMKGISDGLGIYRLRFGQKALFFQMNGTDKLSINTDYNNVDNTTIKGSKYAESNNTFIQRAIKQQVNNEDIKRYIDTSNTPLIALLLVRNLNTSNPEDIAYFEKLGSRIAVVAKDTKYDLEYKQALQALQSIKNTGIGAEAPNISLQDPNGKIIELKSLRGKVVLLDFWASWCRPCRMENPNVVAMYKKYKNKGFTVYSVSLDKTRNDWVSAIQQDGLEWENHVSDLQFWNSAGARLYNVSSIPATFLIDKDGKIIDRNLRGAALEAKLLQVLN